MDGGALNMIGDASVAGSDYGVEAENAAVTAIALPLTVVQLVQF